MSSEIRDLIQKLRQAELRRHRESIAAIDTLEQNMLGEGAVLPAVDTEVTESPSECRNGESVSNVDKVLSVLTERYKTVESIVRQSGLSEEKARAVLYGHAMKSRLKKRKIGKRMCFCLSPRSAAKTAKRENQGGPPVAQQVRNLLQENQAGMTTQELREALPDVGPNAISTSLYNMKVKSRTVVHDENTGSYRLRQQSE